MSTIEVLTCRRPCRPAHLVVEPMALPRPRSEVLVEVKAAAVNPFDVKRAAGYGRRLLGLKGAGRFPRVLGNDFAGVVREVGPRAGDWRPGERVFGLLPTGPQGSHAGAVVADARWLRRAPPGADIHRLAALPYSFTTAWLALKAAGLTPQNAAGLRAIVHGASGALGRLALQLLVRWGARVTAVSGPNGLRTSLALGAEQVVNRLVEPLSRLPAHYDASLNFAAWEDDAALLARLHAGALGHATTAHPLLENFDRFGWIGGLFSSLRALRRQRRLLEPHSQAVGLSLGGVQAGRPGPGRAARLGGGRHRPAAARPGLAAAASRPGLRTCAAAAAGAGPAAAGHGLTAGAAARLRTGRGTRVAPRGQ